MPSALSDHTRTKRAVFFVSDSTGITSETLGNALLANFPGFRFERHTTQRHNTAVVGSVLQRLRAVGKER